MFFLTLKCQLVNVEGMEIENRHLQQIALVGWFGCDSSMDDKPGGWKSDDK